MMRDFNAHEQKFFYDLFSLLEGKNRAYYSVCVKKCPKKGETPDCMTNTLLSECPMATYDTENYFGYCFPTPDTMQ